MRGISDGFLNFVGAIPVRVHRVANCALSSLSELQGTGTYVLGVGELVLQFFYLVC